MNKRKIILNRARCKNCGTFLESKHRHNFVVCDCFEDKENTTGIFIDGGTDYLRRGGNLDNFEDLSIVKIKDDNSNRT